MQSPPTSVVARLPRPSANLRCAPRPRPPAEAQALGSICPRSLCAHAGNLHSCCRRAAKVGRRRNYGRWRRAVLWTCEAPIGRPRTAESASSMGFAPPNLLRRWASPRRICFVAGLLRPPPELSAPAAPRRARQRLSSRGCTSRPDNSPRARPAPEHLTASGPRAPLSREHLSPVSISLARALTPRHRRVDAAAAQSGAATARGSQP